MIDEPPPFKGLNFRIPIITRIKRRGFINQGLAYPFLKRPRPSNFRDLRNTFTSFRCECVEGFEMNLTDTEPRISCSVSSLKGGLCRGIGDYYRG